jgi:hypothetical protein
MKTLITIALWPVLLAGILLGFLFSMLVYAVVSVFRDTRQFEAREAALREIRCAECRQQEKEIEYRQDVDNWQ